MMLVLEAVVLVALVFLTLFIITITEFGNIPPLGQRATSIVIGVLVAAVFAIYLHISFQMEAAKPAGRALFTRPP